ncbi:hypothetical protein D3C73_1301400 [compost metagenome]
MALANACAISCGSGYANFPVRAFVLMVTVPRKRSTAGITGTVGVFAGVPGASRMLGVFGVLAAGVVSPWYGKGLLLGRVLLPARLSLVRDGPLPHPNHP